jgi:ABC-type antimicrobial peptide transport system permease subunit
MIRSPQFRESPDTANVHEMMAFSGWALLTYVPEARQNAIKSANRLMISQHNCFGLNRVTSQLYEVSFWDPLALAVAAGALAICAVAAAMIPASIAASISPIAALRTE